MRSLPPQVKLVATLLFVIAVVATRREAMWAFAVHAALLAVVAFAARIRLRTIARRMLIEGPFLAAAALLPFVADGDRVAVGPLRLSESGLWGAWAIVAKGTLGVGAAVVLSATTSVPELLRGLQTMRCPAILTSIASFMVRYVDIVAGDVQRMRVARISRADDPRWFWQAKAVVGTAGALFVRSYERGERVHLAMLSRGFDGTMPRLAPSAATARHWATGLAISLAAIVVALASWSVWR